ncbi:MAG: glycosyltransferase [Chloroflexi bacterium]|nr:glycosyltransferase [Chloroflexota bacterium]
MAWYIRPFWTPDLPNYLAREIGQFDVIHVHGTRNFMTLPVVRLARRYNVPFVVQPHGALPVIVNSFWVKRLYDRLLGNYELERLSALIVLQESEKQQALVRGIPEDLISIIPNGLDTADLKKLDPPGTFRRQFNIPESARIVLFLGRINKKKGTDMLVDAFAQLKSPNTFLVIAGPDDGQLEEVKQLVISHNLIDRVRFTGLLNEQESMMAYQDAELFVLPCRVDTFPTTIIESCLMNTPMVITEGCESAHLVKGKVADVVPFDAVRFAEAIDGLLHDNSCYVQYQANCPPLLRKTFQFNRLSSN